MVAGIETCPIVFPTGVGMNREDVYSAGSYVGVPHRRGDEPMNRPNQLSS